jgi:hypothetical protein
MESREIIKNILEHSDKVHATSHTISPAGFSVRITHDSISLGFWVDVWIDKGDILTDWNQYIFDTTNEIDILRDQIQSDCDIYDIFTSVAIDHLINQNLIYQSTYSGEWYDNLANVIIDQIEAKLFLSKKLNEQLFNILDRVDTYTINDFCIELDWAINNDYELKWEIMKNYSNIDKLNENAFDIAKNDLINDIKQFLY